MLLSENQAKNAATNQKQLKVFIGGITSHTKESDIKEYFSKFGRVNRAVVNKEHFTNKPRGSGFVIFHDVSSVAKVLSQSVHILKGKQFDCQPCLLRDEIEKNKKKVTSAPKPQALKSKEIELSKINKGPVILAEDNNNSGSSQHSLSALNSGAQFIKKNQSSTSNLSSGSINQKR